MTYPSPVPKCEGQWSSTNPPKVSNENESEVGPYGMREATAKSVNTYYVQLISDIGICPVVEMSEKMGIEPAGGDELKQVPSVTLGVQEMSPLTMAAGYAAFASRGTYCTPVAIESIKDANGKSLDVPKSKCTRAMNERTADTINTLLKGVVQDGTGTQAGLTGRPSAGKTGTTDSRYAAWFVGYTPNLSGAVWVGDPQHQRKMIDITIGGDYHAKVFGGGVPGPIWRDAVAGALEGKEAPGFVEVPIADPPKKDDKEKDEDDRKPRDRFPGGGNGGLIGGGGDGGTEPNPTFSIPEGFIQGPGNGSGGRRWAARPHRTRTAPLTLLRERGAGPSVQVRGPLSGSQPAASRFLTWAATRPPSARPATLGLTIFMTAPIARGPSAPPATASFTASSTMAASSSSDSCCGRYSASTSPSARSRAADSVRPPSSKASADSRRFFASRAITFCTSSSESSRAEVPETSSLVIAVRVSRSVEERSSSRDRMAAVRSSCRRFLSVVMP